MCLWHKSQTIAKIECSWTASTQIIGIRCKTMCNGMYMLENNFILCKNYIIIFQICF